MALAQAEEPPGAATRSSKRWSDLRPRILSAAVMVPVALACIWVGGVPFALMVGLMTIGMAHEWRRMCRVPMVPKAVLMIASLPLAVFVSALGEPGFALGLLVLVMLASWRRGIIPSGQPGDHWFLPLGVPYIGVAAIALVWLRGNPADGRAAVITLLLVIWATDIGAYIAGRAIGGPKLVPAISPGKTWSGAGGGLMAGAVAGCFAAGGFHLIGPAWLAAIIAGLISCVGQAGDLLESGLKRHFNVKDSGSLIPGHGGLLDRLDAVLTAAPVAALLAFALGRGVMPWQ